MDSKKRYALYDQEVTEWSDEDLAEMLREQYAPTEIPPCSVCGGKLSIQQIGGGEPTIWACSGLEEDPEHPGELRRQAGRGLVDEHYQLSRFVDRRRGGDDQVMELLRRAAALRAVVESWAPVMWAVGRKIPGVLSPDLLQLLTAVPEQHRLNCRNTLDLADAIRRLTR